MKESAKIKSSCGSDILIDAEDLPVVSPHRWRIEAYKDRRPGVFTDVKVGKGFKKLSLGKLLLGGSSTKRVFRDPNADALDYRKQNLFFGKTEDYKRRSGKTKGQFTSAYKGVYRLGAAWRATLSLGRKTIHIGLFETEIEAALAYDREVLVRLGNDAFTNFPVEPR